MPVMRLRARFKGNKPNQMIDWRPEMKIWPGNEWPVLECMEGVDGGEIGDQEELRYTREVIIELLEELNEDSTDSRIDN